MNCFPKQHRLLCKKQYDLVFQKAKKVFCNEFLVLYRNTNHTHARLGLAVSKKSLAKAYQRNRCKRIVRESFRQANLPEVDIIFLSRKGLDALTNQQLSDKLSKTWQKISKMQQAC